MILAADIGGTKVVLATFCLRGGRYALAHREEFSSQNCSDFGSLVSEFLSRQKNVPIALSIGLAGPVTGRLVKLTNLSWSVDAGQLERKFSCPVFLMNDLVAHTWGVLYAPDLELQSLRIGIPASGNIAVIAAGTGLGQALAIRSGADGDEYAVAATEGGHTDFAPVDAGDLDFCRFLFKKYRGHVSAERVISGIDGFENLLKFFLEQHPEKRDSAVGNILTSPGGLDFGSHLSNLALAGDQDAAVLMNQFFKFYGAEAGNLCLKSLATGGLYICGGIAARNADLLKNSSFFEAMNAKGRFSELLQNIPVHLVMDPDSAVKGAAAFAARRVG